MDKMDLDLKDINQFIGTQQYHKINLFNSNLTDGIIYLMENGYSWFITDSLAVIETKLKAEEFLCIKLNLISNNKHNDTVAQMIITDGNDNILYTQNYKITTAKRELKLFYTDNVLMLNGEY